MVKAAWARRSSLTARAARALSARVLAVRPLASAPSRPAANQGLHHSALPRAALHLTEVRPRVLLKAALWERATARRSGLRGISAHGV